MTQEERLTALEADVAAIKKAISKEQKIADFEATFGSTTIIAPTGKITSPVSGDKFFIPDFTSKGGKLANYSSTLIGKFQFDDGNQKRLPEWYSNIDGKLDRQGTDVGLSVKSPGLHTIMVMFNGKMLDAVQIVAEVVDCSKCGG